MEINYHKVNSVGMEPKMALNMDTNVALKLFIFMTAAPSMGVLGVNETMERMEAVYAYNIEAAFDNVRRKFPFSPNTATVNFRLLGSIDAEKLIEPLEKKEPGPELPEPAPGLSPEWFTPEPEALKPNQFVCGLKLAQDNYKKAFSTRDKHDLKRIILKLEKYATKHK